MEQKSYLHHRELLLWLVLLGLVTSAGLILSLVKGPDLAFPDERQYAEIARNMIRINTFSLDGQTPTAYRPPGYPLFLLVPFSIHDSVHTARMANYVLLFAAMMLLQGIVSRFFSRGAGWASVFLVFCYPVLFYTAGTLYPQTLALFLIVAISWLIMLRRETLILAVTVGLLLGYLALVTPTYLFMLPLCVLCVPLLCGWSWRNSAVVAIAALFLLGGWSVRNYVALGSPIFISANIAGNLAGGDTSNGESMVSMQDGDPVDDAEDDDTPPYVLSLLADVIQYPGDYLYEVANYFSFKNELVTQAEQTPLRDVVMFLSYYSIVALAILRLYLRKKIEFSRLDAWILVVYFSAAFFQALVHTRIRYRLPLDFLLIGMAGIGLYWLLTVFRRRAKHARVN